MSKQLFPTCNSCRKVIMDTLPRSDKYDVDACSLECAIKIIDDVLFLRESDKRTIEDHDRRIKEIEELVE